MSAFKDSDTCCGNIQVDGDKPIYPIYRLRGDCGRRVGPPQHPLPSIKPHVVMTKTRNFQNLAVGERLYVVLPSYYYIICSNIADAPLPHIYVKD